MTFITLQLRACKELLNVFKFKLTMLRTEPETKQNDHLIFHNYCIVPTYTYYTRHAKVIESITD